LYPEIIILEEASLELVPKKYWGHESCKLFESRFGVPPESQILDDNFHHEIIEKLPRKEKRGRPDIVHFALLDIMSTPAYQESIIRPIIHTVNNETILVGDRVRLPRTELRFNGVMSKVLRKEQGVTEKNLFEDSGERESRELLKSLDPGEVVCLTTQGVLKDLRNFVSSHKVEKQSTTAWIVGGFARGHFTEEVKGLASNLISISDHRLAAHVVTARLSYELERSKMV
jgi:rRNA small subunit pseudouridine methyltransferase Nep1